MSRIIKIEAAINLLKKDPLFYLFLSSKELFHSNFWFWLSEKNKSEAYKLFSSTLIPNPFYEREKKSKEKELDNIIVDLCKQEFVLSKTARNPIGFRAA